MLTIALEHVCFLIVKAREFDVKVEVVEPEPGSKPGDEDMREVLEDYPDDPVQEELTEFIDGLSYDEQVDLVTLAWLGRDDYSAEDWAEVRQQAADAHNNRTAAYLLGMPLLGDYLEEGISLLGLSCQDFEMGRL